MDSGTIAIIGSAVLTVLGLFGVLTKALKKADAVKESLDVLIAVIVAGKDGRFDKNEIDNIKKEVAEAQAAWKAK